MNILVIGGGGREHALAWKAAASPRAEQVFVAPGNAGTAGEPGVQNVAVEADDVDGLLHFAQANAIDLTIVGPEAPLVAGVVDRFQAAGLTCFGPGREAAQLEGSKAFTKDFLARHGIPTADYGAFTDTASAEAFIRDMGAPIVVKADGLAAGKGVTVATSTEEAIAAVRECLTDRRFGAAGARVVVEECLQGEEASFICMVDGEHILPLASSQDHKARDDGDLGPNTGGMGAYSPAPVISSSLHQRIMHEIIEPTVRGLAADGIPYCGFLYAGLMIGEDGVPRVLEYNCRFGDPETQPILLRLRSDLVELCLAGSEGRLDSVQAEWDERVSLGVVMAAGGYPDHYQQGDVISGLEAVQGEDLKVFHAGTRLAGDAIVTSGGRVLCVTALGRDVSHAQSRAYEAVNRIRWRNVYYRTDIGYRAVARERA
ncbi:MAG: phosphoribosylamine--glycine ligase [Gammaproteobacteria bacterium]|jgi:phosphoribosylamine--glycine ligase|nr:phosphoribosylamine--glycine ligase [Gammaproteobacteria bacterium]